MEDLIRKLRLLRNEDIIWIIYYFIITFALISNELERKYEINKDILARKRYSQINSTILIIAFFIYLYFTITAWDKINYLRSQGKTKEIKVALESFISSLIFLVGGAYAIYVDYDTKNTSTDIAIF